MDLIQKAFNRAYELHRGQMRKVSDVPYLVHLLDAAKYLMYETKDVEVICAGILHDTLENTDYSEDSLRSEFGERVCGLVVFCTEKSNGFDVSVEFKKKTWRERKFRMIERLNNAGDDELLVFAADKISNLLSIREDLINGSDVWSKFNGSRDDVEWYYFEIFKVLEKRFSSRRIFRVYKDLMLLFNDY